MIVAPASLAVDQSCVAKEPLRALIVLVTLLTAAFAPHFSCGVKVVIDRYLILLVLIGLLDDTIDHGHTLHQVFVTVGSHQHIQGLIFIDLLTVIDTGLAL